MGYSIDEIPLLKYAKENKYSIEDFSVVGDYNFDSLPSYDFSFKYSFLKKFSLWIHHNKILKIIIESWLINSVFHKFRGIYESYTYHKKKKQIFGGTWMDYKKRM